MPHITYETITQCTDEKLETLDREENRRFQRTWAYTLGGIGGLAVIAVLIVATTYIALTR